MQPSFDDAFYVPGEYFKSDDIIELSDMGTGAITSHTRGYYRVMMDGTKFFLPLGRHLSSATRRNIDNHRSEWTPPARCMLRQELMGEKFASTFCAAVVAWLGNSAFNEHDVSLPALLRVW